MFKDEANTQDPGSDLKGMYITGCFEGCQTTPNLILFVTVFGCQI